MKVRHFDIKTAFLNGDVTEDLYMAQPEGYAQEGKEQLVCTVWSQTICKSMEYQIKRFIAEEWVHTKQSRSVSVFQE